MENKHDGPSLDGLHFDLPAGLESPWNKTALRMIASDIKESEPHDMSLTFYQMQVEKRFGRIAAVWRKAQRQPLSDGMVETAAQVEEHINMERDVRARYCRHYSRRRTVNTIRPYSVPREH